MDIQADYRAIRHASNLVCYVHVSLQPNTRAIEDIVAVIYEGTTEAIPKDIVPLFHCHGSGFTEWTAALALIDLLLQRYSATSVRGQMEKWLLSCQTLQAIAFSLLCEVRVQFLGS